MSHLFLFSNIIAAMVGAAALVLLLLAYLHTKEKRPLNALLLFVAATADYLLFIIAIYFYEILLVDTAYGFRAIQSTGIVLTAILILGIPPLYRYVEGLAYLKRERMFFAGLALLVSLPFLAAVLGGAAEPLVGPLRLLQLAAEFGALGYAALHAMLRQAAILSQVRRRLVVSTAPVHLCIAVFLVVYNFFSSSEILEFAYVLFYLSWAVFLLLYALLLLPFHPFGTNRIDQFCKTYGISRREKEIVELVLDGYSNQKMAERLYISPRTVDTHLSNIYRKCGVEGRYGLIMLAKGN